MPADALDAGDVSHASLVVDIGRDRPVVTWSPSLPQRVHVPDRVGYNPLVVIGSLDDPGKVDRLSRFCSRHCTALRFGTGLASRRLRLKRSRSGGLR